MKQGATCMAKITGAAAAIKTAISQMGVTILEEFTYWTLAFPYKNYVEDNRTHLSY